MQVTQIDMVKYFWSSDFSGQILLIFKFIRSNALNLQTYQVKYFWSSALSGQILLIFRCMRSNTFQDQFLFWVKIIVRIYLSFIPTYWIIALNLWWKTDTKNTKYWIQNISTNNLECKYKIHINTKYKHICKL